MTQNSKTIPLRLVSAIVVILVAAAGIGLWTHFHGKHGDAHAHHGAATTALSLNNGKRWETDAPLRTGMQRIRETASPALAAHARRALTPADAKALSASIQENVNYLMQNCKLEPKADAALHVLITDMLQGGAMLAADPSSAEGAALVGNSLRRYPEFFDHPGWVAVPAEKA
jgi:hypothetical protein